jgi:hypothetical protein
MDTSDESRFGVWVVLVLVLVRRAVDTTGCQPKDATLQLTLDPQEPFEVRAIAYRTQHSQMPTVCHRPAWF